MSPRGPPWDPVIPSPSAQVYSAARLIVIAGMADRQRARAVDRGLTRRGVRFATDGHRETGITLHILQVHNRYQPGGEDVAVGAEAALLRTAGHRVSTYAVANPDGWAAAGTLLAAPSNPVSARRVVAAADRLRVDVVHVQQHVVPSHAERRRCAQ